MTHLLTEWDHVQRASIIVYMGYDRFAGVSQRVCGCM